MKSKPIRVLVAPCLLVLLVMLLVASPAVGSPAFPDVPGTHPYSTAIENLFARNIVNGFLDGTFGPDTSVIRQQFAKMIVRTMNYPVSEADVCPFTDVDSDVPTIDPLYPDHYVAVCAARGITIGKTATTFAPYANILRAQLITMVARAANLPEPPPGYDPGFGDFSPDHYPWAKRAAAAGLLQGLQGMGSGYNFWAPATRGECAQMLYNLLQRAIVTPGQVTNPWWAVNDGAVLPLWRYDGRPDFGELPVQVDAGTTLIYRALVRNQLGGVMVNTDVSASNPRMIGLYTPPGAMTPALSTWEPAGYTTDIAGYLYWTNGGIGYWGTADPGDLVGASFWLDFDDDGAIDSGHETDSNVPGVGTPWAQWEFVASTP